LAEHLNINVDDVEEWTIEAIADKIIDAKIDQLNEEIVILSTIKRKIGNEEWKAMQQKINAWKHRFTRLHDVLNASQ